MKYNEILDVIEKKQNLIGNVYQGFKVSGFLIVPSNYFKRKKFFASYYENKNAFMAIQPFKDDELELWAVDFREVSQGKINYVRIKDKH